MLWVTLFLPMRPGRRWHLGAPQGHSSVLGQRAAQNSHSELRTALWGEMNVAGGAAA